MTDTIVKDIAAATAELEEIFSSVTEEQALKTPAAGGWSAAQVVKHLYIVEAGIYRILSKSPDDQAKVHNETTVFEKTSINNLLKNRTVKVEAPEFITRNMEVTSLKDEFEKLKSLRARIVDYIQSDSFRHPELIYPHPRFGDMTKIDWLNTLSGHSARHAEQIREALS